MERVVERTKVDEVASADVVDGAVGVEEKHWYVAVVNNNSERSVAERLMDARMGDAYECYVPTQREKRVWRNGRKKDVDRVLLPAMLFVTENQEIYKKNNQKSWKTKKTKG